MLVFKEELSSLVEKGSRKSKKTLVFLQDNASSHGSRYSREWLASHHFVNDRIMACQAVSPHINPIENLWSMLKKELYKKGKQYCTCDELWKAICDAGKRVDREYIRNLTNSVDTRLCSVLEIKGAYIGH